MKQKLLNIIAFIRQKRVLVVLAALPRRSKIIIAGVLLIFVTGSSVLGYKIYQTQNKSSFVDSDAKPSENQSPAPSVVVQTPLPTASLPIKSPLISPQTTNSTQDSPTPSPTASPDSTPQSSIPLSLNTTSVTATLDKANINEWGNVFGSGFTITASEDIHWTQLSSTGYGLLYPGSSSYVLKGNSFEYRTYATEGTPVGSYAGEVTMKYKTTNGSTGEIGSIKYNITIIDSRTSSSPSPTPSPI